MTLRSRKFGDSSGKDAIPEVSPRNPRRILEEAGQAKRFVIPDKPASPNRGEPE